MVLLPLGQSLAALNLGRFGLAGTEDCGIIRTGYGKRVLCRALRTHQ
jgi:hypothetical protein